VSSETPIPDPALVVLIGPSGSGKSTWAKDRYRAQEVVSSDDLRGVVGSGEHDLDASVDAFALLDAIVDARLRRGLTTVVDTLGLDAPRRRRYVEQAKAAGLPAVAIGFTTSPAECRRRNRARDRSVPAPVLDGQLARMRDLDGELPGEGWDLVAEETTVTIEPQHSPGAALAARNQQEHPTELGFILQVARFPWDADPASWLAEIASAAVEAGFEGIALMDKLNQIPQVGRSWETIPDP
jgi:predicted kinase